MRRKTDFAVGARELLALLALQFAWGRSSVAQQVGYGQPLIEEIRVRVDRNEEALRLSRMAYDFIAVEGGQRSLIETGTWTQRDDRHHLDLIQRRSEMESLRRIFLSRDQASIWEIDPDTGRIDLYRGNRHYDPQTRRLVSGRSLMDSFLGPTALGRQLEGAPLSHWLRPEWATIHPGGASLGGRATWVVDICSDYLPQTMRPHRVWIDQQRGIALQVFTFDNRLSDGTGGPRRAHPPIIRSVQSITHLPGLAGEWVPIEGRIRGAPEDPHFRQVIVDPQTILVGPDAVTSGVFEAALPTGVALHKLRYVLPRQVRYSRDPQSTLEPISPMDIVAAKRSPDQIELLSVLRDLAMGNEASLNDCRFSWTVQINAVTTRPAFLTPPTDVDPLGRPVTALRGSYARKGQRHLCELDWFSDKREPFEGSRRIIEGDTLMQAYKPERLAGVIDQARQFQWSHVTPLLLGMRLFQGRHLLQEVLVPQFANAHDRVERIHGLECYVVDARSPSNINDYARVWIECASGNPLQVDHYCATPQRILERVERITDIKWVPNGDYGWFPIAGRRIEYRVAPHRYERTSTIQTDSWSLRNISDGVHDRSFAMPFRRGAIVYSTFEDRFIVIEDPQGNAITKTPSKRSQRREARQTESESPPPEANAPPELTEPNTADIGIRLDVEQPVVKGIVQTKPAETTDSPIGTIPAKERLDGNWLNGVLMAACALMLTAAMVRRRGRSQS